jgi:hypothetical protein
MIPRGCGAACYVARMPRLHRLGVAVAALALAAACATGRGPIEQTVRIWDLGSTEMEAIGSWRMQLVSGAGTDLARKAFCRPDGACVYLGSTRDSFGPGTDFLALGEVPDQRFQWARTYGGSDTDELDGGAVVGDGFLLFGSSASPFTGAATAVGARPLLVRIDGAGAPLWARTLDGGGLERLHDATAADGDMVLVGYAGLGGTVPSVAVVRVGPDGALRWAQAYDLGEPGYAVGAVAGPDGGTIVAGYVRQPNVGFAGTPFLLGLDATGRAVWARRYELEGPAQPRALAALADGSVALVGSLFGARPARSPFVLRIGADRSVRLGREMRGLEAIEAFAAADAGQGSVIVGGRRRDPFRERYWGFAMVVDDRGRIIAHATLRTLGQAEFSAVATGRTGEYRVAGFTDSLGAAGFDMLVATWLPAGPARDLLVAPRIAERELVAKPVDVAARAQPLAVRATEVPPGALEVRTLTVPTAASVR